jgi:hypothetical protein
MSAKIRQAGHSIQIEFGEDETNGKYCKIVGKRKDNGDSLTIIYGMAHAQMAGLSAKDNWKKNPREMCYCRAMGRIGRMLFADILGGSYASGEISDGATEFEEELQGDDNTITLEVKENANKCVEINAAKLRNFRKKWILSYEGDAEAAEKARTENPELFWDAYNAYCKETNETCNE